MPPPEQSRVEAVAAVQPWLPEQPVVKDQIRFLVCSYDGAKLTVSRETTGGSLQGQTAVWSCQKTGDPKAFQVTFRLVKGEEKSSGVAVAFDFAGWSPKNYVMVPAVVYNGNRLRALGGAYMPEYPREMFFDPKLPLTMSNNPRLALEPGQSSIIELLTGNAATPAMCFYAPAKKRGFILLCEQRTRFGNNGLFLEENAAQDRITFVVSAPGVRQQAAGFGGFSPSGDLGADWKAGDELTMKFRVYDFAAKSVPDLLEKFMSVRKALTGPNDPRDLVPMSKMAETIVPRFKKRWQVAPVGGYYLPENSPDFQLGWVSGFMQTPMLAIDDPLERWHVLQQFDFVVRELQGKSGFFCGGITANGKLRPDRSLNGRDFALTRKNADTLLFFFKFFQILKAQGHGDLINPVWEISARRLAEAYAKQWARYGEFGQYLDPETGEIAVFNSTCAAIAPAGLALAASYFHEPKFLEVAKASAEYFYRRDVLGQGFTGGHSGDTSQDPDADSTYGLLESVMALYWATGDASWLQKARTLASLGATWTLSYDHVFPPQSQIAKLGGHMAGAVWASAQNKHAAPGICTTSGDYLFKLYRATGDVRYAELIRDIQHAHVEATDMPGHTTTGAGHGSSMERIQPTDGEGKGTIGNFYPTQNAWCELNGLMMAMELPGIYLRTDTGKLFAFDHVSAKVLKRDRTGVTLEITNRTPYDAKVSLFAETSKEANKPLSYTAYLRWPKVEVKAGSTVRAFVSSSGQPSIVP
jgi:hypothetical protein